MKNNNIFNKTDIDIRFQTHQIINFFSDRFFFNLDSLLLGYIDYEI